MHLIIKFPNSFGYFPFYPLESPDHGVPQHEKVEADEEPQHPATVAHQGEKGVGLLLPHHGHGVTSEHRDQH